MNIDNNLGMALISSSLSGTTPAGVPQGIVNGAAEGSLFQQMISQMLAENQTAAAAGEITDGMQGQVDGNGDMLSELLLSGGSLTKFMLLDGGKAVGESAVSEQTDKMAENAEVVDMLQALMAGLTGAVPVSKTETAISEVQTVNPGFNPQIAAAGVALEMPVQQQHSASDLMPEGSLEGLTNMAGAAVKAELAAENTGLQTGKSLRTDVTFEDIENTVATGETNFLQAAKTESLKGENPGSTAGEAVAISRTTLTDGNQALEALDDSAEKLNQKSETHGINSDGLGFRNSVQGAASTGEAAALNQTAQPVEANEPYSQIRNEILTKLEQKGPMEFKMQLEPEDLGQIDIKLKLSEGKLIIDIMAANAKTHALLASQVDKLISSMGLPNVQVENVQISQQLNSQTQDSSQSQGFIMNSAMDFSQRKQQEQLPHQFAGSGKHNGPFGTRQVEPQSGSPVSRIEPSPYGSYRMNYVV